MGAGSENNVHKYFVVEEDAGVYNIFNVDDFDDDGHLSGYNGQDDYHRSDFDIVAWFATFEDAVAWVDCYGLL